MVHDRQLAYALATAADIHVKSARKALAFGPEALRGRAGEKAAVAMREMGLLAGPALVKTEPPPPSKREKGTG